LTDRLIGVKSILLEGQMETAWIVAAQRTPFTRAGKGALAAARPDDLLAALFRRLLASLPPHGIERLDEVIVGCAYPEAEQGRNAARLVSLAAGVPDRVPAMTLTRMCASSLEATAVACAKVRLGEASLVLVGGMESMTRIPMGGVKPSPNPALMESRPEAYLNMGLTAERVAEAHRVGRAEQDAWAARSHRRATEARGRGVFAEEIVAVRAPSPEGERELDADDAIRPDSSLEKLAALAPAFREGGSVTAGNACPTSDGASALLVASGEASQALGLTPLGRFVSYAVAGVNPAVMGIGPVEAVPVALRRAGLTLAQIDRVELNEAFASQVVAVVRALGLDEEKTNVNGGAIALGHPLGATGARLVGTLLRELRRSAGRYGLATLCVGGGMGAAMVLENAGGAARPGRGGES
jgi:acetyl-CoA acyltransferase